jgi:regulator of protease activity HflC (stomatin/prohibitin superfamily)
VPLIIAVIATLVLARSVRIANQYERAVVFRLGGYNRTAGPGVYLVLPLVEWQIRLDLRTVTTDVEQQGGIPATTSRSRSTR